jgi:DNA-binding NtrC family response regulator
MTLFPVRNALVVGAKEELRELLTRILQPGVWAIRYVSTNCEALLATKAKAFELIITSEKTSGREDIELLRQIRGARPHTRLIILTDASTPAEVLAAMHEHAFSFFSSPYSLERLGEMIQMAAESPCWDDGIELRSSTPEWIQLDVRCQLRTADRLLQFMKELTDFARKGA